MKSTSKELLESVSKHCYNELTLYKFNNTTLHVSDKYREGRVTALEYLIELTYYYLQEEKKIGEEFKLQISKQLKRYDCLDDTEYKRGLYDALHAVSGL
ncbi:MULTISPECIES: hypothetical protein [Sulfurovum]|uniref:Uncharacterized protein n=1 Tax=Sulfurovum xiamenensis TaxID=3019066 RepID=A0ABT7QRI5_9BACT|nr:MULTISPECIES: hypothetical protein [Sulfurovum]EIF51770.1 hypothetical protein SULAR_02868 [Sulfurovum sp. AR]MDM5263392.1 hypothetical protein [Sulfurovum xiamenensis]